MLHEKCPNTEFFLVLLFLYSNWFGHFSRSVGCTVFIENMNSTTDVSWEVSEFFKTAILKKNLGQLRWFIKLLLTLISVQSKIYLNMFYKETRKVTGFRFLWVSCWEINQVTSKCQKDVLDKTCWKRSKTEKVIIAIEFYIFEIV